MVKTHLLNSSSLLWPLLSWGEEVRRQNKFRQLTSVVLWLLPASVTGEPPWAGVEGCKLLFIPRDPQGAPSREVRVRSEAAKITTVFWSLTAKVEHAARFGSSFHRGKRMDLGGKEKPGYCGSSKVSKEATRCGQELRGAHCVSTPLSKSPATGATSTAGGERDVPNKEWQRTKMERGADNWQNKDTKTQNKELSVAPKKGSPAGEQLSVVLAMASK